MPSEVENMSRQLFQLLSSVMVRPRATLRRILDSLPDEFAVPLIIAAAFSEYIIEDDFTLLLAALQKVSVNVAGLILLISVAAGAAFTIVLFYGFSLLASWIGKRLGGSGNAEQLRSALAWGTAPLVWALLYRVPARFIWGEPLIESVHSRGNELPFRAIAQSDLILPIVILALLEATMAIWLVVLLSKCIGEAHGFSAWRGLGNLLLSIFIPLITLALVAIAVVMLFTSLASFING